MISAFKKTLSLTIQPLSISKSMFRFSDKTWKDRDDAAEKVYISRT